MASRKPHALFAFLVAIALTACGPEDPGPLDAGADAGRDAGMDAGRDAGASCEPSCGPGMSCCSRDGVAACTALASDPMNCGSCGLDCVAARRGDRCRASQCACGAFDIGCTGDITSRCCPATPTVAAHCGNLARDPNDCGECGRVCSRDVGNRCEGGTCVCGDAAAGCGGDATDRCCNDGLGFYACVDTTTDRRHCGACARRCMPTESCEAGACVPR